jgi:hypothetical protein
LGENWENELDEITKSAIKATIAGEDFDYKLPFTDDEATRRLIEGAGSIALQQLGFSLPGAPAHVKSAIEDYYSSQAQPDTRMPAGEKPKFSAPEVIKPKPSKGEAAASTPKEGETAHNLTSPSPSEKGERVIGPNGEEVTLIAESKNTATIKFDDGSVEQHPIEDI